MHIIAEEQHGHWSAWFEGHPETAFGGDRPDVAVSRLVQSVGIDPAAVAARCDVATLTHLEFHLATTPCPDCRGRGQYLGLAVAEDCQTCRGSGQI